jgi:HD-like signal output (HDOD) protein
MEPGAHVRTPAELEDRFKHLTNLPTLPEIASRLMTMVNDPLVSTSDVAAIIAQDPSLSSRVLRLSNSAFYGMPGKINTINHAVVLLGFKIITTIVLSLTVFDMFPEHKRSRRLFDRKAFWLHSLCCGLIARRLAQHAKKRFLFDPEELFCAGLLHDIGKIVLEQYLHEEFHTALTVARDKAIPQYRAEMECLGFSHATVAEWLTAGWGLPAQISRALAKHHEPEDAHQLIDSAGVCHVADWLCYSLGIVIDTAYQAPECDDSIIERLGCTPEFLDDLRTGIQQELESSSLFVPA